MASELLICVECKNKKCRKTGKPCRKVEKIFKKWEKVNNESNND